MDFSVMLLLTRFFRCSTHISLSILFGNPLKKSHWWQWIESTVFEITVFMVHDILMLQVRIWSRNVVVKCCDCRVYSHLGLASLPRGMIESLWLR